MISSRFKISIVFSLQFAAVKGDNVENGISAHRVIWAINDVVFHCGLTAINFNIFAIFVRLYLALQSLDIQKSQTLGPPIYRP